MEKNNQQIVIKAKAKMFEVVKSYYKKFRRLGC